MTHFFIEGIEDPGSFKVSFPDTPNGKKLAEHRWTKLSVLVAGLRDKLHGTPYEDMTGAKVMAAYQILRGERMNWVSQFEYCIDDGNLPRNMAAEIILPSEEAELLKQIFVAKALLSRFETGAVVAASIASPTAPPE